MAGSFYNNKDSMDISELASLNEEISDDLISELQQKLAPQANALTTESQLINENDDSALFEEPETPPEVNNEIKQEELKEPEQVSEPLSPETAQTAENTDLSEPQKKEKLEVNQNFDDNFIKKYKAKLKNKAMAAGKQDEDTSLMSRSSAQNNEQSDASASENKDGADGEPIEKLTQGNITERKLSQEVKDYNDSLDFLDGNVKYSKYVIYIDPQNVDFIEGLTVKERKNLINSILRQQDDIAITRRRFKVMRTIFIHALVAILIFLASVPVVYYAINASLEATINNHRSAQSNWQTLYKEHGKIPKN